VIGQPVIIDFVVILFKKKQLCMILHHFTCARNCGEESEHALIFSSTLRILNVM